jgi:hypothetical protein
VTGWRVVYSYGSGSSSVSYEYPCRIDYLDHGIRISNKEGKFMAFWPYQSFIRIEAV